MSTPTCAAANRAIRGLGALLLAVAPTLALACSVSASPLSFGTINPLDQIPTDSASSVVVTCPAETAFTATVSAGSGSLMQREMSSGTHTLAYQLYVDAARSQALGDGTSGTAVLTGSASPQGTTVTIYGRVPSQPSAIPALYGDTLMVTVTY